MWTIKLKPTCQLALKIIEASLPARFDQHSLTNHIDSKIMRSIFLPLESVQPNLSHKKGALILHAAL